jgi:ABC-2 type transport system permease protein
MRGLLPYLDLTLRLHFRQKLALFYSFLFPLIFLGAFRALYRWETVPLARHVGELLTVVVLSGACLGLPVILVSERERGVWRRYRLAPGATSTLVTGMILARFVLLVASAVLLLALAVTVGMPFPDHPLQLAIGFTLVAFTFSGLGLLLAMIANSVPAAQALGQCVFLPMLVFGGVVVQVASLPAWAQQLSTFLPGGYAVDLLQACANGDGLASEGFALLALLGVGAAAYASALRMFRWDSPARRESGRGVAWVGVTVLALALVGLIANRDADRRPVGPSAALAKALTETPALIVAPPRPFPAAAPEADLPGPTVPPAMVAAPAGVPPRTWQDLTPTELEAIDLVLPPDEGVIAPMPLPGETPDADTVAWLDYIRPKLPTWESGQVNDPVQRVRNFLYAAAVPDVVQMDPFERFFPPMILDHLIATTPHEDLRRILGWIVLNPVHGSLAAADNVLALGIEVRTGEFDAVRERARYYAMKFLLRTAAPPPP